MTEIEIVKLNGQTVEKFYLGTGLNLSKSPELFISPDCKVFAFGYNEQLIDNRANVRLAQSKIDDQKIDMLVFQIYQTREGLFRFKIISEIKNFNQYFNLTMGVEKLKSDLNT